MNTPYPDVIDQCRCGCLRGTHDRNGCMVHRDCHTFLNAATVTAWDKRNHARRLQLQDEERMKAKVASG